ncbi:hypothetical protein QTH49_13485 [Clostridium perfringens]|nr:hypothetical protein [Clostridium perfringens]
MRKELLKSLMDIYNNQEKIENFVEENLKQLFIDSILNPSFSGWTYPVVVNENGELDYYGAMGNGSVPYEVYEGKEVIVYNLPAYEETESFEKEIEIDDMPFEIIESLRNSIELDLEENKISDDIDDIEVLKDYKENNYIEYYDSYNSNDEIRKMEDSCLKENIELSWDNYVRYNIIEDIIDGIGKMIEMEK